MIPPTVIVTGPNGFIGAHLTQALLDTEHTVLALGRSKGLVSWENRVRDALAVELVCDAFRIKGRLDIEYVRDIPKPMTHTEEMILRSLKVYAPYLNSHCVFDLTNTRRVVPDYDAYFSPLDVTALRRIIETQKASV